MAQPGEGRRSQNDEEYRERAMATIAMTALELDAEFRRDMRRELHAIGNAILALSEAVQRSTYIGERIVADIDALNNQITKLANAVVEFETREAATIEGLNATIADLKAHQSNGVDTQPQIDALQQILDSIPQAAPTDSTSTDTPVAPAAATAGTPE